MLTREPVLALTATTAAAIATLELIANVADMDEAVEALLTGVVVAWLTVAALFVRSKVSPTDG